MPNYENSILETIQAKLSRQHQLEIWGDGQQTRSFMYIDDCLEGTRRTIEAEVEEPLNLGSDQLVTINELVDIIEAIAGVRLRHLYRLDAPQGVRGRNSDNTLIERRLGWAPTGSRMDALVLGSMVVERSGAQERAAYAERTSRLAAVGD